MLLLCGFATKKNRRAGYYCTVVTKKRLVKKYGCAYYYYCTVATTKEETINTFLVNRLSTRVLLLHARYIFKRNASSIKDLRAYCCRKVVLYVDWNRKDRQTLLRYSDACATMNGRNHITPPTSASIHGTGESSYMALNNYVFVDVITWMKFAILASSRTGILASSNVLCLARGKILLLILPLARSKTLQEANILVLLAARIANFIQVNIFNKWLFGAITRAKVIRSANRDIPSVTRCWDSLLTPLTASQKRVVRVPRKRRVLGKNSMGR